MKSLGHILYFLLVLIPIGCETLNTKVPQKLGLGDKVSAGESCKTGLVKESNHCCWKGQGWSEEGWFGGSCVGTPICPIGWSKSENTCLLPSCSEGQTRLSDGNWGHCCWKGQVFSTSLNRCVGTPTSCPTNFKKTESTCTRDSSLGIETVLIPAGSFTMGCKHGDCNSNQIPSHQVILTKDFYLMKTEVTQAVYKKVMEENPSKFKGDNKPVDNVDWDDAVKFANKLSIKDGLEPCYVINEREKKWLGPDIWVNKDCKGWRLPTEAEWEYAAMGGEDYKYAGSNNVDEVAWYGESSIEKSSSTHDVGQKKPNGYGLYDMSGNVREWVWDKYKDYQSGTQIDPIINTGGRFFDGYRWWDIMPFYHFSRGGGYWNDPTDVDVSKRLVFSYNAGFRLGYSLE
mgnify:CR=1 FL=1